MAPARGLVLALLAVFVALGVNIALAENIDEIARDKWVKLPSQSTTKDRHMNSGGRHFGEAFSTSFGMILATEIGDKTFFIAALLAMRHDFFTVFLGAHGALAAMTVLSAGIGFILPALLSKEYTHWAAIALFVYFGGRQMSEAVGMFRSGEGAGPSGELEEVEASLKGCAKGKSVAMQAFFLTFLAEWGDRSQIATIALGAAKDAIGVTLGGVIGHGCCTGLAVLGGRVLAAKISERGVLAFGGALFLIFALHGVIMGPP